MKAVLSILLSIIVFVLCQQARAQQDLVDSLRRVFITSNNDSVKCEILYQIGVAQESIDYKVSRKIFDSVILLAKKGNYTYLQAKTNLEIAGLGFDHGDYPLAIEYYNKASVYYRLLNGETRIYGLAAVYNNLGGILTLINDWESAQKYYFKALQEFEKIKDTSSMVTVYFNISFLFSDLNEWNKSYDYMYKSLKLIQGSLNKAQNIRVCSRLATICFKTTRITEGLQYLHKADSLLKFSSGDLDLVYYHHAYGEYYFHRKDYSTAISHHRRANFYAIKWDDPYYIVDEASEIGRDYLQLRQFDSAEIYFQRAFDVATRFNYQPKVLWTLMYLSDLEEAKGNYKKAYEYKRTQALFADNLVRDQNHYRILLMDQEFEAERKTNEIQQLHKDKQIQLLTIQNKSVLNYFLIGSIVALVIVIILGYYNFRHRHQLAKQNDQLLEQQINELQKDKQLVAVDSMLKGQEDERSRLAKDLHDGLGGILSGVKFSLSNMKDNLIITPDNMAVFERSLDMIDTSIQELRRVAHNMMPEILIKFGLDEALKEYLNMINNTNLISIKYQSFGLDKRMDGSTEIIIYRIIQELLNNMLKHASASQALVQVIKENSRLSLVVEDNGKGFDPAVLENNKGAGWMNIRSRVDYLKGQLELHSDPGKGTSVNIEFKL